MACDCFVLSFHPVLVPDRGGRRRVTQSAHQRDQRCPARRRLRGVRVARSWKRKLPCRPPSPLGTRPVGGVLPPQGRAPRACFPFAGVVGCHPARYRRVASGRPMSAGIAIQAGAVGFDRRGKQSSSTLNCFHCRAPTAMPGRFSLHACDRLSGDFGTPATLPFTLRLQR